MNIDKPLFSLYLEKRRVLKTGVHAGKSHIKIVVTFIHRDAAGKKTWDPCHYQTGVYCKEKDFARVIDWQRNNIPTEALDVRAAIIPIKRRAELILETVLTRKEFETRFLSNYAMDALAPHYQDKIDELNNAKPRPKISSREKYKTSLNSLQGFFGEHVTFDMLTPESLQSYEDWYISQEIFKKNPVRRRKDPIVQRTKSLTSVGINLRCARHIYKRVIRKGIVPETSYPFGIGGYVIPEGGDDTKKFMESQEKQAFLQHEFEDDRLATLHDYAKFSFFAFGINLADVARLRKTMVFKEYISIDRQKTKGRKKKTKKHNIPIHPIMREIIKRRGNKSLIPDDYVFPILERSMDEETIFRRIRSLVDDVNSAMAIIAKKNNFEIKPTSYTLRHTFSFNVSEMGATTEQLQDMLAHGSIKTTEAYKHGFALQVKKKFSDGLG